MGITSAAEAKLDARIRPDITQLRSRTSYPRRHRPPLSVVAGGTEPGGRQAGGYASTGSSGMLARSSAETISRTVRAEQTTWRIAGSDPTTVAQAATAGEATGAAVARAARRPSRARAAGGAAAGWAGPQWTVLSGAAIMLLFAVLLYLVFPELRAVE